MENSFLYIINITDKEGKRLIAKMSDTPEGIKNYYNEYFNTYCDEKMSIYKLDKEEFYEAICTIGENLRSILACKSPINILSL